MRRGDLRRALVAVRRRTHRGPALRVRLLEKPDCDLCAEAHRALRRVALDRQLEIERVDVERGPAELRERYRLRVPVIVAAGEELDAAGLDDAAIHRWLGEVERSAGLRGT